MKWKFLPAKLSALKVFINQKASSQVKFLNCDAKSLEKHLLLGDPSNFWLFSTCVILFLDRFCKSKTVFYLFEEYLWEELWWSIREWHFWKSVKSNKKFDYRICVIFATFLRRKSFSTFSTLIFRNITMTWNILRSNTLLETNSIKQCKPSCIPATALYL